MAIRTGRKRIEGRDIELLESALHVLAENGYEGMTIDMVAAHAKAGKGAIYRRWDSKEKLVLDAVSYMKKSMVDLNDLPDTGSLRGDLLALFRPQTNEEREFKLKVMSGLSSLLSQNSSLVEAANSVIIEPWAKVYYSLMQRAVKRGEVSSKVNIKVISNIVPSMGAYRSLIERKPFDKKFLISILDAVVLPALGIKKE